MLTRSKTRSKTTGTKGRKVKPRTFQSVLSGNTLPRKQLSHDWSVCEGRHTCTAEHFYEILVLFSGEKLAGDIRVGRQGSESHQEYLLAIILRNVFVRVVAIAE